MTKTMNWPARAMYLLFALALVIGLGGIAAMPPASADSGTPGVDGAAQWNKASTPSTTNLVIQAGTDIIDVAVGSDGATIYAVGIDESKVIGTDASILWKSTDGGWTWTAKDPGIDNFYLVSVAPDDVNFVTVANADTVAGSVDGAAHFATTGFEKLITPGGILDMDIAEIVGDSRHVLVGTSEGEVVLLKAGAFFGGTWSNITTGDYTGFTTITGAVTSVAFSPNYATDDGVVVIGADDTSTYLQRGRIGTNKEWYGAIPIVDTMPLTATNCSLLAYNGSATGIALPSDYDATSSSLYKAWVYVDYNGTASADAHAASMDWFIGEVYAVGSSAEYCGVQTTRFNTNKDYPLMASIDMYGTIDDGKMMVGTVGTDSKCTAAGCCVGVQVWRTTTEWPLTECCPKWAHSSKSPTGKTRAIVAYSPADGSRGFTGTSALTPYILGTVGGGDTATWSSTPDANNGTYSVSLNKGESGSAGSTHLQFTPSPGTTFADLNTTTETWSYWYKASSGTPHVYLELRFVDPADSANFVEVTDQMKSPKTDWTERDLTGSDAPDYCFFYNGFYNGPEIDQVENLVSLQEVYNHVIDAISAADTWVLDRVRLELWEASVESCYFDDVTIDGVKYRMEPIMTSPDFDESAFSLSSVGDVGRYWNQIGLIDTEITKLTDVAVNPECGTIYLFSANDNTNCGCDSVWRSINNGGRYMRVWNKDLAGDPENGLIRLAPEEEETSEVLNVYLVDQGTNKVYWNEASGLTSWTTRTVSPLNNIVDLAVENKVTVYALDGNGDVSKTPNYGIHWDAAVASKAGAAHTIDVMVLAGSESAAVIVGPASSSAGKVGYSLDGGKLFQETAALPVIGDTQVTFDSNFSANSIIYAATSGATVLEDNGVFRYDLDTGAWKDLHADDADNFYGLVTGKSDGTLYAAFYNDTAPIITGVARLLSPQVTACCGVNSWDYLTQKTSTESFTLEPSSLKICGCLSSSSNSKLWAIDDDDYNNMKNGRLWYYEDCLAKVGVTLTGVADGTVIDTGSCGGGTCGNVPFTLTWNRLCDTCEYDYAFSLTPDFSQTVLVSNASTYYHPYNPATPTLPVSADTFVAGQTYYWRVRAHQAETGENIRSPWSPTWSFSIASGATLSLTAPVNGAADVGIAAPLGFTWSNVPDATYDFSLTDSDGAAVASGTGLTSTSFSVSASNLAYNTTYFWNVQAKDASSNVVATSATSTFATGSEPTAPPVIPTPTTPYWVWVVIAIGAILVIVTLVLIFRTRRV